MNPDNVQMVRAPRSGARADRLQPVPPRREGSRVVFAGGRLGWLTKDALLVFDPKAPTSADLKLPLGQARGVGAAGDGFIAIGHEQIDLVLRVDAHGTSERWRAVLAITPYGIVRLFADGGQRFWVAGQDALWPVWLRLRGGILETGDPLRLSGQASQREQLTVTRLSSGAFVHAHEKGLTRLMPDGPKTELRLPAELESVQTMEGGAEGDRWWLGPERGLALVAADPAPHLLKSAALRPEDELVHALGAGRHHAAAALVKQASGGRAPTWSIAVFGDDGLEKFRAPLPWQPEIWEDPDVSVAVSSEQAQVAVASAGRVVVWDLASARVLAERKADGG